MTGTARPYIPPFSHVYAPRSRQFFQWLDAFEMTITAAPERTLRDDGRHFVSNIVLQIVNAALNLLCPLPSDLANTKQPSFAHTTCTERVLPEVRLDIRGICTLHRPTIDTVLRSVSQVYNERITRGLIQNYMQSKWVLENDTRSEEEVRFSLGTTSKRSFCGDSQSCVLCRKRQNFTASVTSDCSLFSPVKVYLLSLKGAQAFWTCHKRFQHHNNGWGRNCNCVLGVTNHFY